MRKLTWEEIEWLEAFNQRLWNLQEKIEKEFLKIRASLKQRCTDADDPLSDFDIVAQVTFDLHKDDPAYLAHDRNEMTTRFYGLQENTLVRLKEPRVFPRKTSANKGFEHPDCDFGVQNHSYIFRDLYAPEMAICAPPRFGPVGGQLDITDILRIGAIRVNIKLQLRYYEQVHPCPSEARGERQTFSWPEILPIPTYSGAILDPYSRYLNQEHIRIEDIAQGLSNPCMYPGQTKQFYSYAQHSIILASIVSKWLRLGALLNCATVAYMGEPPFPSSAPDVTIFVRGVGQVMSYDFPEARRRLRFAIYAHFGLSADEGRCISPIDVMRVAEAEKRDLFVSSLGPYRGRANDLPERIVPMWPEMAKQAFLRVFEEEMAERSGRT